MEDLPASFVLERLDALPTPSPLALRLLAAANDERSSARDLVELIRQDSALTARVLSLCRRGPRGRALDVASLDRAVVLLGFGAVRAAALAVEFVGSMSGGTATLAGGFDPLRFWRHALAKAIVAEHAARLSPRVPCAGRAFVAGLLHDIGILALHAVAPAPCDRCCEEAERDVRTLDERAFEACGLTATAIGVRLAERWGLPEELLASLALRGDAAVAACGPHRGLVLACELADRFVRRRHIGGAGFGPTKLAIGSVLEALAIDASRFAALTDLIFEDLSARADALGVESPTAARLASEAIERASRRMELSRVDAAATGSAAEDIDAAADTPALLAIIVRRLAQFGGIADRCLVLLPGAEGDRGEVRELAADGAVLAARVLGEGDATGQLTVRRWCEIRAPRGTPSRLALSLRGRTVAEFHRADGEIAPELSRAHLPLATWSLALAASIDRDRMRRTCERLAEAHRIAAHEKARSERLRVRSCVAEIASGLAHELNNPLTVVSLQAQLARRAAPAHLAAQLDEIVVAAERASQLVARLLRTVRPLGASIHSCDASEIVGVAIGLAGGTTDTVRVTLLGPTAQSDPIACAADPAQVAEALAEVIQNALAATKAAAIASPVDVLVERDPPRGRCMIRVRDCGAGFTEEALAHACEPFFSQRQAGRGMGLGLARARALLEASGGSIELRNVVRGGAGHRTGEPGAEGAGGAEVLIGLDTDVSRVRESLARRASPSPRAAA